MSLFKKTMFALAAASLFIFAGCSSSDDLNVKVAEIDATIDGIPFTHKAVAKVSDETAESGQDSKISEIFSSNGTLIYFQDLATKEKLIVTYAGKSAGIYNTGLAGAEELANNLLEYLVTGASVSLEKVASAKSNVTYIDAEGNKWFSTTCKVKIDSQENGVALTLINGTFECYVYKVGNSQQKKLIKGSICNVLGF